MYSRGTMYEKLSALSIQCVQRELYAVLQVASKPFCHLSEGDLRFSASGCHFILRHPPHYPPAPAGNLSWSRPPTWALRAAPNGATAFLPENPPLRSLPGLPQDTTQS